MCNFSMDNSPQFYFVKFVFIILQNHSLKIFLRKVCFIYWNAPLWGFASVSLSLSLFLSLSLSRSRSRSRPHSLSRSLSLSLYLCLACFVPVTVGVSVGSRATHFFFCPWRQSSRLFQKEPFCGRIGISLACALCYVYIFPDFCVLDTSECGCLC